MAMTNSKIIAHKINDILIYDKFRNTLETPQIIGNIPISHRFISLLSDIIHFTLALSHNYADDA